MQPTEKFRKNRVLIQTGIDQIANVFVFDPILAKSFYIFGRMPGWAKRLNVPYVWDKCLKKNCAKYMFMPFAQPFPVQLQ